MQVRDKIEYIVIVLGQFAKCYGLTYRDAYLYVSGHRGLDIIDGGYEAEHLFSIEDAVSDVAAYCRKHGGDLA